ncbi:MAG TPA: C4-type zinc ribbon domain-containing protein [Terriglobales bacterium]|nr:C4-type zinc ribbon domain-containing protein [Terriglobales bacterium]
MSPDLQNLIELDRVTQEISRLMDEIAQLPKLVAAIESKLAKAKAQVASATAAIKNQEADKRKHESDIQDWQQKISKFRDQSLSVKTNEQYKALMHEIEFAQKMIAECEEKILLGMEGADGFVKALKDAEVDLKLETAEIEKEKEHARTVTVEDQAKLVELRKQQAELKSKIEPSTLAHFERVSAKRKGAIAEAIDQKCSACNVKMRPQRYNELLSNSGLVVCESCSRILFYDPTHQTANAGNRAGSATMERAWRYVAEGSGPGKFVAFVNSKTTCTMRTFDAATGQALEKVVKKKLTFKEAFVAELSAGVHLRIEQPDLEGDCSVALPSDVLEELQLQAGIAPGASTEVSA